MSDHPLSLEEFASLMTKVDQLIRAEVAESRPPCVLTPEDQATLVAFALTYLLHVFARNDNMSKDVLAGLFTQGLDLADRMRTADEVDICDTCEVPHQGGEENMSDPDWFKGGLN